MGLYSRVLGTIASFFQVGGPNGPGWNDNSGALESKNSGNSAFAITRGATPVGANDYVTKGYVDSHGTLTPPLNGSWAQATWFIDPVSGSDTNSGFTSGSPLKTWQALVALWGTYSPRLRQNTTITFLSSHSDNTDPVYFTPYLENLASCFIVGTLGAGQQIATGTLGTVVSKNRTTPQLLNAVLPAGASINQLVVNTTHPSHAWTYKSLGSNNFAMTQPFVGVSPPSSTTAEVDTWAASDTVTIYQPVSVNLVRLEATNEDINGTTFTNALYIQNIKAYSASTSINSPLLARQYVRFYECDLSGRAIIGNAGLSNALQFNDLWASAHCEEGYGAWQFVGGAVTGFGIGITGYFTVLDGDFIIGGTGSGASLEGPPSNGNSAIGLAYIDTSQSLSVVGGRVSVGFSEFYGSSVTWGPGLLFVGRSAALRYNSSNTAVATFLHTGGIQIASSSTANAIGPTGITSGISLTAANLDLAVGAGGFGGNAFLPTGGSITNQTATVGFTTGTSAPPNGSWTQATWFIDPVSGSDSNTGFSSGVPLKTWKALVALWGTYSPRLRQNTTITFLSSHTDDSDPVYFRPLIENNAIVILQGTTPTVVATGTMGTVTPLNRSTPQLLNAVLPTGSIAAGQMIQNTTHSSRAWVYKNVTGTTWSISTPIAPVTPPHNGSTPAEVAWTTGDSYTIYQPVAVNIAELTPTFDYNGGTADNFLSVYQLQILDPTGDNLSQLSVKPGTVSFYEVSAERCICSPASNNFVRNQYYNCDFLGSINDLSNILVSGGQIRATTASNVGAFYFTDDCIIGANVSGPITVGTNVYIESGKVLNFQSGGDQYVAPVVSGPVWGPGTINVSQGCTLLYTGTATANFLLTGGFTIAGSTVAYSINNTTLSSNISITAAHLDAGAGPAGFGGTAFILGGGAITNNASTQTSALTQSTWFIDPTNSQTTSSDSNTGLTSGTALRTWAEVIRRYGTNSPRLRQTTTFTFLSSHTDNTDPVYFNPYLEAGAAAVIQGTLGASQQVATGTLGTITAKNRLTPQLLNAVLTSGLAVGQLIVNSTHSSRAWLYKNVTGNTWAISQPMAPVTVPAFPSSSSVDTWTAGDTYTVYTPVSVNIVQVEPVITDYNSGFSNGVTLYQLQMYDPRGTTDDLITFGKYGVFLIESGCQRSILQSYANQFISDNSWINCDFSGGCYVQGFSRTVLQGGMFRTASSGYLNADGISVSNDCILACTFANILNGGNYSNIYIEAGTQLLVGGSNDTTFTGTPALWGFGKFLIIGTGRMEYPGGMAALSGTFTVNNGSASVTASTNQNGLLLPGSIITFSGGTGPASGTYTVFSVSGTTVTLLSNYTGTNSSGASATVGQATVSFPLFATLTGTFTVSNGSPNVTATSSQTNILVPGSIITFGGGTATGTYTVLSASGTAIVLTSNYTGTGASGASGVATSVQGQIQINALSTAFTWAGSNPVTMYGGIPITAANLDASAGTNGFGGNAFNLGGGSLTNSGGL